MKRQLNVDVFGLKGRLLRFIIPTLMFMFIALAAFAGPRPALAATNVDTFAELKAACQSSGTVNITSSISLTDTITIPSGVTVYLTCSHDAGSTSADVSRAKAFHGHMFKVNDGATLYIRCCINGNLKNSSGDIRGFASDNTESSGYYGQAMILNYGTVIMDSDKSVLKNNYNAFNNSYANGTLWTYDGVKYYGLDSDTAEGETALAGSAILCVNGDVTMSNGQIYGCYADNGPAIYICNGYSGDQVKISGGKIHDNLARRYGGAIFAASRKAYSSYSSSSSYVGSRTLNSTGSNAMLTISGGNIYENVARLNSGAVWTGFGATLYMSGGSIYKNVAIEEGGGALRVNAGGEGTTGGWMCFADPGGQTWIAGGSIYSNTCATNGGGITVADNDYANNLLKITGGSIYSNTAGGNGGGVYVPTTLTMTGGSIYKNAVNGSSSKGGGIYLTGASTATISGGKVYSNTAVDNGGGVSSYGSLTVSGGYFYGNAPYGVSILKTGKVTGGRFGVSAYTGWSEYTVSRNTKAQIHVGSDATLSIAGGTVRIVSTLVDDEAIGANVGILNNGITTVETSCNSDNGYTDLYGTGTSIQNTGTLNIKGKLQIVSSAKDEQALQYRRGIYNTGTTTVSGDLVIRYCSFRAVHNTGTFNMNAGAFYGNEVDGNGGAVYNTGTFKMAGGSMYDNSATSTGGAVYNTGDNSCFNMSGGSLYNNSSTGMGGAVYFTTAGLASSFSGGSVYGNMAGTHGGAIASYRTNAISLTGAEIYDNAATSGGGAVYNGGTLSIGSGADIHDNSAGTHGGAVSSTGAASVVNMTDGSIYNNTAVKNGGGIYVAGSDASGGKLAMSGGAIYNNTADSFGGGVYFATAGAASTISGGSIYGNSAVHGGGMSSYRTTGVTLSNVKVYSNTASGIGGGIRTDGSLTINSGFYYDNDAVGVYVNAGSATINGGRFGASAYTNFSTYTASRNETAQIAVAADGNLTINNSSYPRIISTLEDDETAIAANYGLLNYGTVTVTDASANTLDFYGTGTSISNSGTLVVNGRMQIITSGLDGNTAVQRRMGIFNSGTVDFNNENSNIGYCGSQGIYNDGIFHMKGGNIYGCAASDPKGGGVYNSGTFDMTGGTIYSNTGSTGDGIYNESTGVLKMSGTALVESDDSIYLEGTSYITVGDFTGDENVRAYLNGDGFTAGRVVAKYADTSAGAGTDALYWDPDAPSMSEQYFAVSGKILRAGDQGAASNTSSGISAEDVFISDTYTLSFNGNLSGVTVTVPSSVSKYWGETKSVTFSDPSVNVTYVSFLSWNTKADGSGNSYTSPLSYATNMDLTLYAQWKGISYTIKYNGNGATSGSTASSTHTYGVAKNLTENGFIKTGHTFNGWNTAADGSGTAYSDKQSVSNLATTDGATVNLYAQWKVNTAAIRYHVNGGSISSSTYSLSNSLVYNGSTLITTAWSYGKAPLDLYNVSTFGLYKTGYHVDAGSAWLFNSTTGPAVTYNSTTDATVLGYFDAIVESATGGTITMYANWKANTYTVVYDGNGATSGSTASSSHTYDTAKNLTANGFSYPGYAFSGWNTKADGSGTSYTDKQSVKNLSTTNGGTVTLYAQWKVNTASIRYHVNGGSISSSTYSLSNSLVYNGSTLITTAWSYGKTPLDLYNVSTFGLYKTGYHVDAGSAWLFNSTTGPAVTYNSTTDATVLGYFDAIVQSATGGTITMYANWKANTYTVVYDGNGATSGSTTSSSHTYDTAKNLTANGFSYPGYTFSGWNTKADGSGTSYTDKQSVKNLSTTNGGTVTLYAQWTPIVYTIKYDGNGETSGTTASSTHTYGVAKSLTANGFIKTGYAFVGWNTKSDGSGTAYSDKQSVKNLSATSGGTVTLYAQWAENTLTVVYHSNAATQILFQGSGVDETYMVNNLVSIFNYSDTALAGLCDGDNESHLYLIKTGHAFTKYWLVDSAAGTTRISQSAIYTGKSLAEAMGKSIDNASITVHVYAEWLPNSGTIYFYPNGGTAMDGYSLLTSGPYVGASSAVQSFDYTDMAKNIYDVSTLFQRTGYHVVSDAQAWLLGSAASTVYISQTSQDFSSYVANASGVVLKLYANWAPNLYTVVYDGNGATGGSTASSSHTYDVEQTLTANGYVRDEYVFVGWNTKADGSGTSFADQERVANLAEGQGDTVTLYAIWIEDVDEGPTITAEDRWFTLEEAQAGVITLDALMATATAEDSYVGRYTNFSAGEGTFTIINYHADDFTAFTDSGSVTVTYFAEDFRGNVAYAEVTVHIVNLDADHFTDGPVSQAVRFISRGFYIDGSGAFVDEADGGLSPESRWVTLNGYVDVLTDALTNIKVNGVWTTEPKYSFLFHSETIEMMKEDFAIEASEFYNRYLLTAIVH